MKRKGIIGLLVVLLFFCLPLISATNDNGSIIVLVKDSDTNQVISGASVIIRDSSNTVVESFVTDSSGLQFSSYLTNGVYSLSVGKTSYNSYTTSFTIDNTTTSPETIQINLIPIINEIDIEGIIYDSEGIVVPDATVFYHNETYSGFTTTNNDGEFIITVNEDSGILAIHIIADGFGVGSFSLATNDNRFIEYNLMTFNEYQTIVEFVDIADDIGADLDYILGTLQNYSDEFSEMAGFDFAGFPTWKNMVNAKISQLESADYIELDDLVDYYSKDEMSTLLQSYLTVEQIEALYVLQSDLNDYASVDYLETYVQQQIASEYGGFENELEKAKRLTYAAMVIAGISLVFSIYLYYQKNNSIPETLPVIEDFDKKQSFGYGNFSKGETRNNQELRLDSDKVAISDLDDREKADVLQKLREEMDDGAFDDNRTETADEDDDEEMFIG